MTLCLAPADVVSQSTSPLLRIAGWWKRCRLGDIAEVTNGGAFPSARFNTNGDGLPLIRIRDVGQPRASTYYDGEYKTRHLVETGDLLIGMDGDFRIARWRAGQALLNQRVCRLKVYNSDLYSDRFLEYVLQPYLDEIHKVTSAVTVKHLSSRTVQQLPIPLSPRDEQERIVGAVEEYFSRLDAAEATVNKALERLKTLRRSILAEAFSGRLVPQDLNDEPASKLLERIVASHPTKPKRQETKQAAGSSQTIQRADPGVGGVGDRLPEGWVTVKLGDVCLPVAKTDPRRKPDSSFDYIDIGGIESGSGRIQETKRLLGASAPSRARQVVCVGDIVLSTVRTYQRKTAIVPVQLNGAIASTGFAVLRVNRNINPRFVLFQVLSDVFVEQLNRKQTGSSYPAVRDKDVRAMNVRIAPSLEQERIVATIEEHLSLLDTAEATLNKTLERLKTLRRSILAEAFSGRLVPQDPNDEPAYKLLERITASQPIKLKRRSKPKLAAGPPQTS